MACVQRKRVYRLGVFKESARFGARRISDLAFFLLFLLAAMSVLLDLRVPKSVETPQLTT